MYQGMGAVTTTGRTYLLDPDACVITWPGATLADVTGAERREAALAMSRMGCETFSHDYDDTIAARGATTQQAQAFNAHNRRVAAEAAAAEAAGMVVTVTSGAGEPLAITTSRPAPAADDPGAVPLVAGPGRFGALAAGAAVLWFLLKK